MTSTKSSPPPKICYTVAGCLIHDDKVLMVQHKRLGIWLSPGGHIEPDELPHTTAEREFFEETGVEVTAYDPYGMPKDVMEEAPYFPSPVTTNLHWVSKQNYDERTTACAADDENPYHDKTCEKHLNFIYLVKPKDSSNMTLKHDPAEVTAIRWFAQNEISNIETLENIRLEVEFCFGLVSS